MRLIDADYVKSKLNKAALGGHLHYYVCGVIDDAPTIDVELVKHGEWLEYGEPTYKRCSSCGKRLSPALGIFPQYCSNCGAKMYGGENE